MCGELTQSALLCDISVGLLYCSLLLYVMFDMLYSRISQGHGNQSDSADAAIGSLSSTNGSPSDRQCPLRSEGDGPMSFGHGRLSDGS